jgi:UPF0271 protein
MLDRRKTLKKAIILDTTVFILGYKIPNLRGVYYTVPSVRRELKKNPVSILLFDEAVKNNFLSLLEPEIEHVSTIKQMARKMGENQSLSETDIQILALGNYFKEKKVNVTIFTDDFSIQNLAEKIGVKFNSLSSPGIQKNILWSIYCPGCFKTFEEQEIESICDICGTKLKRKPIKETK